MFSDRRIILRDNKKNNTIKRISPLKQMRILSSCGNVLNVNPEIVPWDNLKNINGEFIKEFSGFFE